MAIDYDTSRALKRIENELIDSMIRNLRHHRAEEIKEGMNWEQWQVLQLKALEKYRLKNPEKYAGDFTEINQRVSDALRDTYNTASTKEEAKILEKIKAGKIRDRRNGAIEGSFFGVNEGRLAHLIDATKADFARGEWAMLRQANDQYRKVIFDAQMYSATGATYEQAVDMATKDFLKKGITSITYKNGARHTMADYASMAIRTGQKRAYLMGEGDVHDKYGIHTVQVAKRTDACPLCVKWLGRVLVDDVYSGGTAQEAVKAGVPLLSQAIEQGFLHPNCKDIYTMYIEGVSEPAKPWTKEEMQQIADGYNNEQALKRAEDMADSYDRMARCSLDPENQRRYRARADIWADRAEALKIAPAVPVMPKTEPKKAEPNTATSQSTKYGQEVVAYCKAVGIKNDPPAKLATPVLIKNGKVIDDDLIRKISGADQTKGSCVSLAMTYIGNMLGFDVRDFRGGTSCRAFALNMNNRKLTKLDGVKVVSIDDFNAQKGAKACMSTMEQDKIYMLVTGRHASIVRKVEADKYNPSGLEYLELQSRFSSGWTAFEDTFDGRTVEKTLKNRFGCTRSMTVYGTKMKQNSFLIEAESLRGNPDFEQMLGYINTQSGKEKRGAGGGIK